jgi:DNA-binding NarL/FixJ family response regulator
MNRARIGIVEDDPQTRAWLEADLFTNPGYELIGSAESLAGGRALLSAAPDVLLIDIGLPDGSGLELIAQIHEQALGIASIVLSVLGDAATVTRAIAAGANGYLLKAAEPGQVARAIASVMAGGAPISPAIAAHVLSLFRASLQRTRTAAPSLTPRERAVLEALARGRSFKEVAHELELSVHTVTDHVKAIYRKLAVNSRAEVVYAALQAGLVQLRS